MTNNTTAAALTHEQIRSLKYVIGRLEIASVAPECEHANNLRALLISPRAAVPAPEGWKLVPIEPTQKMLDCWWDGLQKGAAFVNCTPRGVYGAMLDAAPAAPVAEYDGNHVQNHCPECNEHEAECSCAQAVAADGDSAQRVADGLEACDWSGVSIGNKAIIKHAISLLRATVSPATATYPHIEPEPRTADEPAFVVDEKGRFKSASPATADERAAFVEKLRELGADISPLGFRDERLCITSNIMVDDVLAAARASQAAAPVDAREPDAFDRWEQECERDHGPYPEDASMAQRLRWWIPKSARHGKTSFEHDISDAADMLDSLVPADAGEAVAPAGSILPTERGIYAWVAEGSSALVLVHTRPTDHSPGGVMNASLLRSCDFYNGCPVDQWSGGTWYGPFKHVDVQGGKGGEA